MSAERGGSTEAPPKYDSPENVLKNISKIDALYTSDIDSKSPLEVEALVARGLREGVFVRAEGEDARADDLFGGFEVQPAHPVAESILERLRMQEREQLQLEYQSSMRTLLDTAGAGGHEGVVLANLLEDALRQGKLGATVVQVETKVPTGRAGSGSTRKVMVPEARLTAIDGRSGALRAAFETLSTELDPSDRETFKAAKLDVTKRLPQILEAEKERTSREHHRVLQEEQAQKAREANWRLELEQRRAREMRLGGTRDFDPTDPTQPRSQESLQAEAVRTEAHKEALQINREDDQLRVFGSEQAVRDSVHAEALRIEEKRQAKLDLEQPTIVEINDRYNGLLAGVTDKAQRAALESGRKDAVAAERQRVAKDARERTAIKADSIRVATEALAAAADRRPTVSTITRHEARVEEKAQSRRTALKLEAVPFLERKAGGLLHLRSKNRGPMIIESYFRAPDNERLVVLERRNRRTGDLLSQTVMTTEQPLRKKSGNVLLPPVESLETSKDVSESDRNALVAETGSRRGVSSFADYLHLGLGTGDKFDGPHGIYRKYGASRGDIEVLKHAGGRRGGIFFRFFGGR